MTPGSAVERPALEALCARLAPAVYGLGLADTKSAADAEDLVQSTLLAFLEALAAGKEIANPEAWALRVAANALKRRGRRRRVWRLFERPPEAPAPDDVALQVVRGQAPAIRAFHRLGRDERRLVALYRLSGRSDSETAAVIGTTAANVRQRLVRAFGRLAAFYLQELLAERPRDGACLKAWALLPRSVAGAATEAQRRRLEPHLQTCPSCARVRDELRRYCRDGLTALLPVLAPTLHRRGGSGRLVADLAGRTPRGGPAERRRRRLRPAGGALLLLLLLLTAPAGPPALNRPAGLVVTPAPAGRGLPDSEPPARPDGGPSPAPGATVRPPPAQPAARGPCPAPTPRAGYAYLDGGDIAYRPRVGAAARRLTASGGRVDAFWWSPDGTRLAYREPTSPPDLAGDVRVVSLSTGEQLWRSGAPADYFAFSPDGSRYAVATRVISGGGWVAEEVRVGAFDQPGSATDYRLPLPNTPYSPTEFQDTAALPQSVSNPLQGLFWAGPLIDFNVPALYDSLDPSTGAVLAARPDSPAAANSWLGIPPQSRFRLDWNTGGLRRLCAGAEPAEPARTLGGRPDFMNVSADGGSALLSLNDGAANLVWLQPDGTITRLSSDGVSAGARWRP